MAIAITQADRDAARRILGLPPEHTFPAFDSMSRNQAREWQEVGAASPEPNRPYTHDRTMDKYNPPIGYHTQVLSSNGQIAYDLEVRPDTVNGGTYMFCTCAAWKFSRGKGKDCKHVLIARANWSRGK